MIVSDVIVAEVIVSKEIVSKARMPRESMSEVIFTEMPVDKTAMSSEDRWQLLLTARRIPRLAAYDLQATAQILDQANALLRQAQAEAEIIKQQALEHGLKAGRAAVAVSAAEALLDAQREARAFVEASEPRIVQLVFAVLQHILPRLPLENVIDSMVGEAIRAVQAERYVRVYLHPDALASGQTLARHWQQLCPDIRSIEIASDARLALTSCRVESELGSVSVGLMQRFEKIAGAYGSSCAVHDHG